MSHDQALALAGASLPAWVLWLPVTIAAGWGVVAAVLARVATRIAVSRVPRDGAVHWTERAVVARRVRVDLVRGALLVAVAAALLTPAGPFSVLSWASCAALAALSALFGWSRGMRPLRAALGLPVAPAGSGLRSAAVYALAFVPHLFVLVLVLSSTWGRDPIVVLVATAVGVLATVLLLRGGGLRLARALGATVPAPERLARIVDRAAQRSGRSAPPVVVLPSAAVNAFAFVYSGELGITSAMLERLDDAQIEAVVLHELGHLGESTAALRTRATSITAFATFALLELEARASLWLTLAHVVLVIAVARWVRTRAHALEQAADAHARDHVEEEGAYARALETIYRVNLVPAVLGRGRVHPDLYDRMIAAGVTPDYPRPAPPAPRRLFTALWVTPIVVGIAVAAVVVRALPWPRPLSLALGDSAALYDEARARAAAGHPEEAIPFDVLYDDAYDHLHVAPVAALATDQISAGWCEEARVTLEELDRRYAVAPDDRVSPSEIEAYWAASCGGAVR